jgi:ABC transport system ATP-binding/permease protein
MSLLLSSQALTKGFSGRPLFRDITLGISEGEKIGLIGPNGSGKSTLLKIWAGVEPPDTGETVTRRALRLVYVPQEENFPAGKTLSDILSEAVESEHWEEHEKSARYSMVWAQLGLPDASQTVETLSGGQRKRLALGVALMQKPELLLLDEPTNHLDLDGVLWLQGILDTAPFAFVVVTHDRIFLENVTTRIIELNRAYPEGYLSVEGGYSDFLVSKEDLLDAQTKQQHALQGKVAREIAWLRRGAPARTTKAQGRIHEAERLIAELAEVKYRNSQNRLMDAEFGASKRKTKELLVAKGISKSLGGRVLFQNLDVMLSPGTRLGLIGRNGSGKTTLLRTLTGHLTPDAGTLKTAENLTAVYFDQARDPLERTTLLRHALSPNSDNVQFRGQTMHVSAWAKRFLFRPEQLDQQVGALSGGEQARILLANLMLQSADLLILDEPTNDLDIPSLEVLEDSLTDFPGAVILVSHDRYLLDRVSTDILALDGNGGAAYFADYPQWEAHRAQAQRDAKKTDAKVPATITAKRRLSTAEQRELAGMEDTILAAEANVEELQARLTAPDVVSDHAKMQAAWQAVQDAEKRVEQLYARWEELENLKSA